MIILHSGEPGMTCACGHNHNHSPPPAPAGRTIPLERPLVSLTGRLICADTAQMLLALELLSDHVELSRAEPGNLRFDLAQAEDPLVWELAELYADEAAFQAHRARLRESRWGRESHGIARDFTRTEPLPRLRPEAAHDQAAIAALLTRSFGGEDEADLVAALRAAGDLALSLVAEAEGTIIGHVALSPLDAARPAFALAPLAVHPALHGRGIGEALVQAALEACRDHSIVVLGDPNYYARFGFAPAELDSPYAGPHLMALGPQLPAGSRIAHAPAFGAL
ncbi:GCN5-related N-acetyltransferase [Paracoccus aminovorans]|nr:GCN5-related N-acetyltransferase [Paracoccus aminovorans]